MVALMTAMGCKERMGSLLTHPQKTTNLQDARKGYVTKLVKNESTKAAPNTPPDGIFSLIHYPSPAGDLAAYVSPDPGDGEKHPIIIWLTGGFSNSVSPIAWSEHNPIQNDQSASAYRKGKVLMMYPSLRGGNNNPGFKEGLYGEVDDVLAAAEYASNLPWVDANRIYLGGHSTGGTLALLVAESGKDRFRAVFSFGPVERPSNYGQEMLPYDIRNAKEDRLRSPIAFLDAITCPTFVMEGEQSPNSTSLISMRKRSENGKIHFLTIPNEGHFSILGPSNALIASKILNDKGRECELSISVEEVTNAIRLAQQTNYYSQGDIRSDMGLMEVTFYYKPDATKSPEASLRKLFEKNWKGIPVVSSFSDAPEPPFILYYEESAPFDRAELPDEHSFKHFVRGMKSEDIKDVRSSRHAAGVVLVMPKDRVCEMLRQFNDLALEHAEESDAFIWDCTTRECFHRDMWKRKRLDLWKKGELPDICGQITMHIYKQDESDRLRIVTLGMDKFALPDVVIERVLRSNANPSGNLVNVLCQTLVADPVVMSPESFMVHIASLHPKSVSEEWQEELIGNGTGKATLALMRGVQDEGDSKNNLIEIDFRHGAGATPDERSSALLSTFWGTKDAVSLVRHNEQIKEASEAARRKLADWKLRFRSGLPTGSRLMVKGPFARDDEGNEWMWIEVLKWDEDGTLHGILKNDPAFIKNLKDGSEVTIHYDQVFDYLLYHADGSTEGNETSKLIQEQSEKAE